MNNTGWEKLSRLLMSNFKHSRTVDQLGEERDEDGGERLRERSEEDASCLLNSVACLCSGVAVLYVSFLFIVPYSNRSLNRVS